jgi:hypothetical protein
MHPYTEAIQALFKSHADPLAAVPMKRYMRDQFEYLGLKSPLIKALRVEHLDTHGLPQLPIWMLLCANYGLCQSASFNM